MIIKLVLLLSLFFNIAHASVIASKDSCEHETVQEYVLEQSQSGDCGDLCDLTYMFNFVAIVDTFLFSFAPLKIQDTFIQKTIFYTPPFQKTNIKPPIA